MPAYTHLQRAQVTSLAQHLLAYFWMLERDRTRLEAAREACLELPLGAGAAVGLDFDLDREAVAADLGFSACRRELARRGRLARLRARLPRGRGAARRPPQPPRRRARPLGYVRSSASCACRTRSAAARASCRRRRTRTPPSCMRAAAPRLTADLGGLLGVLHGLPLAYNTDLREDKRYLFDAVDCLDRAAAVVRGLLEETHVRRGAHGGGLRPVPGRHRRRRLPRGAGRAVPRGAPPHRRPGAPLSGDRASTLPRSSLDDLRGLSPAFDDGYYALHEPAVQLARKRSRGGSAPARVREQLERARAGASPRAPAVADCAGARSQPGGRPKPLPQSFFARSALEVARDLIGCAFLVDGVGRPHRRDRGVPSGRPVLPRLQRQDGAQRRALRSARPPLRLLHLRDALLQQHGLRGGGRGRRRAAPRARARGRASTSWRERRGLREPRLLCLRPGAARAGARHRPRAQRAAGLAGAAGVPRRRCPARRAPEVLTTARIGVRGDDQKPWRFVDAASRLLSRPLARTPIRPAG